MRQFVGALFGPVAPVVVMLLVCTAVASAQGADERGVLVGDVLRVDYNTHLIVIQTERGVGEAITFTDKTALTGMKDARHIAETAGKTGLQGAVVVLFHAGTGADRVATRVQHLGKRDILTAKGAVVRVDNANKTIVVRTEKGEDVTYDVTRGLAVDTGRKALDGVSDAGDALKVGTAVTVHYSQEGARKIAHVVRHL